MGSKKVLEPHSCSSKYNSWAILSSSQTVYQLKRIGSVDKMLTLPCICAASFSFKGYDRLFYGIFICRWNKKRCVKHTPSCLPASRVFSTANPCRMIKQLDWLTFIPPSFTIYMNELTLFNYVNAWLRLESGGWCFYASVCPIRESTASVFLSEFGGQI